MQHTQHPQAKYFCLSWCLCMGVAHCGHACRACSACCQQDQQARCLQGPAQAGAMGDAWHTTQAAAAALAALSASGLAQPAPGTRSSSSCLQDGRQLLTGRHFSILGERLRQ